MINVVYLLKSWIAPLDFVQFLERCTGLLDLPFAARRLFDEMGREHFSLATLHRDQLVYVSCGEPWSDPNLSKAEQQRRYLLANLASDVAKIQQFIALRDPQGKCNDPHIYIHKHGWVCMHTTHTTHKHTHKHLVVYKLHQLFHQQILFWRWTVSLDLILSSALISAPSTWRQNKAKNKNDTAQ